MDPDHSESPLPNTVKGLLSVALECSPQSATEVAVRHLLHLVCADINSLAHFRKIAWERETNKATKTRGKNGVARKAVSIPPALYVRATGRQQSLRFETVSQYVQCLIRNDLAKGGPLVIELRDVPDGKSSGMTCIIGSLESFKVPAPGLSAWKAKVAVLARLLCATEEEVMEQAVKCLFDITERDEHMQRDIRDSIELRRNEIASN